MRTEEHRTYQSSLMNGELFRRCNRETKIQGKQLTHITFVGESGDFWETIE